VANKISLQESRDISVKSINPANLENPQYRAYIEYDRLLSNYLKGKLELYFIHKEKTPNLHEQIPNYCYNLKCCSYNELKLVTYFHYFKHKNPSWPDNSDKLREAFGFFLQQEQKMGAFHC
jgi:hypothetical protein